MPHFSPPVLLSSFLLLSQEQACALHVGGDSGKVWACCEGLSRQECCIYHMLSRAKLTALGYLVQSPTCPPAPHGGRFLRQQVFLPLCSPKGDQTGWKQQGLEKQMEQREQASTSSSLQMSPSPSVSPLSSALLWLALCLFFPAYPSAPLKNIFCHSHKVLSLPVRRENRSFCPWLSGQHNSHLEGLHLAFFIITMLLM